LEAGDFFLGSALSTTLTKLVLRSFLEEDLEASQKHAFAVEVLLIMVNILKLGKSPQTKNQIDDVPTSSATHTTHTHTHTHTRTQHTHARL
jgi:predicted Kef-type K+ transport protein